MFTKLFLSRTHSITFTVIFYCRSVAAVTNSSNSVNISSYVNNGVGAWSKAHSNDSLWCHLFWIRSKRPDSSLGHVCKTPFEFSEINVSVSKGKIWLRRYIFITELDQPSGTGIELAQVNSYTAKRRSSLQKLGFNQKRPDSRYVYTAGLMSN